jgi:hypothetical protein
MNPRLIGIGLVVFALVVAIAAALVLARLKAQADRMAVLEGKLGVSVVPFWGYVKTVLAAELTHPHERYAPLDRLIAESLLDPGVPLPAEKKEQLFAGLDHRSEDISEDMRPREQAKAQMFKLAFDMARLDADNPAGLTGLTVVGKQQPELQQGDDGVQEKPK